MLAHGVGGGRMLQEVQTSKSVFVLVDVDEEGYLRYEGSRSTSSGDDASSVSSIDISEDCTSARRDASWCGAAS